MLVITTITPHPMTPQSSSSPCRSVPPLSRRFPLMCSVLVWCIMLLLGVVGVSAQLCSLTIPTSPLSIGALTTPWVLSGAGCSQANPNSMTFVQGAVLNLRTGAISIYDPLVVDANVQTPFFAAPVVPTINQNDGFRIAYWVQSHAPSITLIDKNGGADLVLGNCTSGSTNPASNFGKFAFCGAFDFFTNAKKLIAGGQLMPAALGKGSLDGMPCPSSRDFSFIGRDSHATVMTTYLLNPTTGATAHDTPANNLKCNGQCVVIQSDSARTLNNLYTTLGCALWVRPDLTDANLNNQQQAAALPLNEIQAYVFTANAAPNTVALVPASNTLTLVELNRIRDALNQPEVATLAAADPVQYCTAMTQIPPPRLAADAPLLKAFIRQGNANEATNLFTLVVKRQIQLYTDLGCPATVAPVPFTVVPANWNVDSKFALADATPIQPQFMGQLRCQNMFIFDTKCSFLIALLVVGGGIVLGFAGLLMLRVLQAWKYGDKAKQDSTRAAIRV